MSTKPLDDWFDLDDLTLVPTGRSARDLPPDKLAKTDAASGISLGRGDSKATVARFKCPDCRDGVKIIGFRNPRAVQCRRCKGKGLLKTDPAKAAIKKRERERKRLKEHAEALVLFQKVHAAEWQWMTANAPRFSFAAEMVRNLSQYSTLTTPQLEAVRRCMARDAERAANPKPADTQVQGAGLTRMLAAFAAAKVSGLLRPKLRLTGLLIKLAGQSSTRAGDLFVYSTDDVSEEDGRLYLGRIDPKGQFFKSRDCTPDHQARIVAACTDPLAAAVAYGQQSGSCSCCGLTLTNAESIRLGIGPICREKWGL